MRGTWTELDSTHVSTPHPLPGTPGWVGLVGWHAPAGGASGTAHRTPPLLALPHLATRCCTQPRWNELLEGMSASSGLLPVTYCPAALDTPLPARQYMSHTVHGSTWLDMEVHGSTRLSDILTGRARHAVACTAVHMEVLESTWQYIKSVVIRGST